MYGLELGRSMQRTEAGHIVAASRLQLLIIVVNKDEYNSRSEINDPCFAFPCLTNCDIFRIITSHATIPSVIRASL